MEQKITRKRFSLCPKCEGAGELYEHAGFSMGTEKDIDSIECKVCEGNGKILIEIEYGYFYPESEPSKKVEPLNKPKESEEDGE